MTALPPQTSRIDRYTRQRDEWQNFVCTKLRKPIERTLRELAAAATIAANGQKKQKAGDPRVIFTKLIENVKNWTNLDCQDKFECSPEEIDACLRMAVRAQATVIALTLARTCNETIKIPKSQGFFRAAMLECGKDQDYKQFCSDDVSVRKGVREWIDSNIRKCLLDLVPVCLFAQDTSIACQEPPMLSDVAKEDQTAIKPPSASPSQSPAIPEDASSSATAADQAAPTAISYSRSDITAALVNEPMEAVPAAKEEEEKPADADQVQEEKVVPQEGGEEENVVVSARPAPFVADPSVIPPLTEKEPAVPELQPVQEDDGGSAEKTTQEEVASEAAATTEDMPPPAVTVLDVPAKVQREPVKKGKRFRHTEEYV